MLQEIFLSYTPRVEPISLDEAFLDVTETVNSFNLAITKAKRIKKEIEEKIGITCSFLSLLHTFQGSLDYTKHRVFERKRRTFMAPTELNQFLVSNFTCLRRNSFAA